MSKDTGDFLSDWLGGKKAPDPLKLSRRSIKTDRWDEQDLDALLKAMPDFDAARDQLCDTVDTGNGAWADTYFSFLKVEPESMAAGAMRPDYLINKAVNAEMQELNEYEELRGLGTVGDDVNAALACVTMREDLEGLFDKLSKEQELSKQLQETMEGIAGGMGEAQSLDELIDGLMAGMGQGDADADAEAEGQARDFQQQKDKLNQSLQEMRDQAAELADQIQKGLEAQAPAMRNALQNGLQKAVDEAKEMQAAGDAWGIGGGYLQRLPADERIALAKRINNPRLKKIAELFGPMRRLMFTEQRRKVNHAREEVFDIEKGNDLGRVLPMQFAALDDELTELLFFKDYVEGSLLQYEMRGEEKVGKGGIIYVEDGSGSMAGDREMWAKAVGLCLLNLARAQKRSFRAIHFGSANQIWEKDFSKPEDFSLENILAFAEVFFNGGTDFMTPLSRALDHLTVEFNAAGCVSGDVVFATDGSCGVSEQWLEEFKKEQVRLGFQVWGVSIGGYVKDEPLATICDNKVFSVKDLTSGDEMRPIFGSINATP